MILIIARKKRKIIKTTIKDQTNVRRSVRLAAGSPKPTTKAADLLPIPEFDVFEDAINDVES